MADVLKVEKRGQTGSAATRRLRRSGSIPAVLYGHGEETQHLAIPATQVKAVARNHSKMVELSGAITDTALVSELQWDPLGIDVLHLDLIRVNLKEKVDVTVAIQSHGDPVGVREGGVFVENAHDVEVRCSAGAIPDNIGLNVNELHTGQSLLASDLDLPEGVELLSPADTVIAHVEEPRAELDEEQAAEGSIGLEPEVISKGGEDKEQD
jgi:large subunit ribosomal protein L25